MFQNTQTNTKYICKENTYQNTPANKNLKNISKSTMCRAHKQNTGYFCKDQSQRSKHKMSKTQNCIYTKMQKMTKYQDTTQSCKKQSHLLNHTICKALTIMCFKSNKQKNTAIAITPGRI